MNTSATTAVPTAIDSASTRVSSWSVRRGYTLVAALALIIGGIAFACSSPNGFIEAHLIERRITLGAAAMVGGFLLLAVHVLTGILAVQPQPHETKP
jgi:ABC-type enterobactin transport system permease subunit